jgi:peptidoglycan/LPS O-acetylase OafA/YrhL
MSTDRELRIATHVPSLDGLRAIAVLLVMLLHASYGHLPGGWIGVDIFFILSGYLITTVLLREFVRTGTVSLAQFYTNRALRLLPALAVLVIATNVFWAHLPEYPLGNLLLASCATIFYFANLVSGDSMGPLGHTWSLAVEEHFYFAWPPIFARSVAHISVPGQLRLLALLVAIATAIRIGLHHADASAGPIVFDAYAFTLGRADCILIGCALAVWCGASGTERRLPEVTHTSMAAVLAVVLFVIVRLPAASEYWRSGGFVVTNMLCLIGVVYALQNPTHRLLSHPGLAWIGKRSYGMYLYHTGIFSVLESLRTPHSAANFASVTALRFSLTFLAAALSFAVIERPCLRLRNRLGSQQRSADA